MPLTAELDKGRGNEEEGEAEKGGEGGESERDYDFPSLGSTSGEKGLGISFQSRD